MKILLVAGILLALVAPLRAETYSWMDDGGTFHFTEDYSRIPRKYRKRVNRRDDLSSGETKASTASVSEKADAKSAAAQQLVDGKTEDEWRSELTTRERELTRLEGVLEHLQKQVKSDNDLTRERLRELTREYNEARETYNGKYAAYSDLLESARKAGFTVTMKK